MALEYQEEQANEIIRLYIEGISVRDIGLRFGKSDGSIIGFLQRKGAYSPKNRRWAPEEIEYLRESYPTRPIEEIEKKLKRDKSELYCKAYKLKISRACYGWTAEDIAALETIHNGNNSIAKKMLESKFSKGAIYTMAHKRKLKRKHKWTEREDKILRDNYSLMSMDKIMKLLPNRGRKAIISRAGKFSLINYKYFTSEEVHYIVKNCESMSDEEIANVLGRTRRSIKWKRGELGLLKTTTCSAMSGIYEYLHTRNRAWRVASMDAGNYKCVITGTPVEVVHHLYASNLILNDALTEVGIDHRQTVGEYSSEELESILQHYVNIHNQHPLGVCLTEDVHKLFHKHFGYGDNTPEQFELFKQRYLSGAYNA